MRASPAEIAQPQQIRAELGMGGPQVGLHLDRTLQQHGRFAIAPAHDLEVRQLFEDSAVARVVVERPPDPGVGAAFARRLQRCAQRVHFERRQLLFRSELSGAIEGTFRRRELPFLERHARGEQVRLGQLVILLQHFFEQRLRLTFEAFSEHLREA